MSRHSCGTSDIWSNSFHPSQWFVSDEHPGPDGDGDTSVNVLQAEVGAVWVYRKVGNSYVVGFYDPQGHWHPDETFTTTAAARIRVNYLNGGVRAKPVSVATPSSIPIPNLES